MTTLSGRSTSALSPEALDQLFREAHTAFDFTDEPVTDQELALLYDLVRHGPTAMNSQPLRVTFVRSPEARARLRPYIWEQNRPKYDTAPVTAILSADTDFHEDLDRTAPHLPEARKRFLDDAFRTDQARFNAALQAGYFIIAARSLGLDAGPFGGFDKPDFDADFLAGTAQQSFLGVNLGHMAEGGHRDRQFRLPQDEAVTIL